jgi:pentose-5-phosphate-3-epimerase
MTTDNNITIIMQDVDVVMALNPEFKKQILIAATSRGRTELNQKIEKEATEKAKK